MKDNFTFDLENSMDNLVKGAFLTSADSNKANTMTISWGSVGFMWGKPMFMAMIRQTRYTKEFIDSNKEFTISIPYDGDLKKALAVCGSKSGRDIDKEKEAGIKFVKSKKLNSPVVEGCKKYYECKVVFKQEMDLSNMDKNLVDRWYGEGNTNHTLYFAEIVEQY